MQDRLDVSIRDGQYDLTPGPKSITKTTNGYMQIKVRNFDYHSECDICKKLGIRALCNDTHKIPVKYLFSLDPQYKWTENRALNWIWEHGENKPIYHERKWEYLGKGKPFILYPEIDEIPLDGYYQYTDTGPFLKTGDYVWYIYKIIPCFGSKEDVNGDLQYLSIRAQTRSTPRPQRNLVLCKYGVPI